MDAIIMGDRGGGVGVGLYMGWLGDRGQLRPAGTTKLGTKLVDHSFFIPMLLLTAGSVTVGAIIGAIVY